jgi:NADH-quinone oxidoreductase subunit L/multicomponent Na+:H+ antiporter subunit D
MKLTLFFCAGALHVETHTDDISNMAGIGKRMPLTMGAFAVAAAGMAGIPLVAGFVSKYFLLIGTVSAGQLVFTAALLVSGILNIAYFWPVVYTAFFESQGDADAKPLLENPLGGRFGSAARADGGDGGHGNHEGPFERRAPNGAEGSWFLVAPILFAATGSLVLGIVPDTAVFLQVVREIVANAAMLGVVA